MKCYAEDQTFSRVPITLSETFGGPVLIDGDSLLKYALNTRMHWTPIAGPSLAVIEAVERSLTEYWIRNCGCIF